MYETRQQRIEFEKQRLLRDSIPRIYVSVILALTALAGFLSSFCLLQFGIRAMWVRYPIATMIAYGVFLLLLAIWLWLQHRDLHIGDSVLDFISHPDGRAESLHFGGGGDFSGGGAGGTSVNSDTSVSSGFSTGGSGHSFGFDLDLEEAWLIVLAIVALLAGVLACLYIVYIAPALLAEILVDGALVAGLYKRIKPNEERHWLRGAVRQTCVPALLVGVFLAIAGFALQKVVPAAITIGDVFNRLVGA
jgi:hypothetical protein